MCWPSLRSHPLVETWRPWYRPAEEGYNFKVAVPTTAVFLPCSFGCDYVTSAIRAALRLDFGRIALRWLQIVVTPRAAPSSGQIPSFRYESFGVRAASCVTCPSQDCF